MSVTVGKEGRVVLPKNLREKLGVRDGDRMIVREHGDQIVLIPLTRYEHPTEALYGSVAVKAPLDEPKTFARRFLRKKLRKDLAQ